jgi:hypothetical protein
MHYFFFFQKSLPTHASIYFCCAISLVIGLFGLIGMAGVSASPFIGRMIDRLGTPWYSSLLSTFLLIIFQAIETGAGGINVAAVVIVTFGQDVFRQLLQVSLTASVLR